MNTIIKTLFTYYLLINCSPFQKNVQQEIEADGLELLIENDFLFYSWNNEEYFNAPQTVKYKIINNSNVNYILPFNPNEIIINVDSINFIEGKERISQNQKYKPKMFLFQKGGLELYPNLLLGAPCSVKNEKNRTTEKFKDFLELSSKDIIHFSSEIILPLSEIDCYYEVEDTLYNIGFSYSIYLKEEYEYSLEINLDSAWYYSLSQKDRETMRLKNQTPFFGKLKSNKIPIKLIEGDKK